MNYSYVPFSSKPRSEIVSKICGKYRIKKKNQYKTLPCKGKIV